MQLATKENGLVSLARAKVQRHGLLIDPGLKRDEWLESVVKPLANLIHTMEESARWWWGDALAYGEQNFGDIADMADRTGYSYDSMKACKYVSQRIDISRRRPELSWSHHAEVAMAIDNDEERSNWLNRAIKASWSKSQLRKAIRLSKAEYEDIPNDDAGMFAPIAAAKQLSLFFQHDDVRKYNHAQRQLWLNDLHPIVVAYDIMFDAEEASQCSRSE